ncbi:pentachlorophenol 4-monooxygenase [Agrocybe pediades]|nr:pentachlorophenol 4-monooxygenase [Agrocybe pediades]
MPRSLETLESLGILDEVLRRAINVSPMNFYKMPEGVEVEKEYHMIPYLDPIPSQPYRNALILGQDNLDKILRAELEKFGCHVELGAELKSFDQDDEHVRVKIVKYSLEDDAAQPVEEEANYKWVIGADGARGVVRKQLGLSFLGETTEQRMITGDLMVEGLSPNKWHMWGALSTFITSIRPTETEGLFNFIIGGGQVGDVRDVAANEVKLKELLKKSTGNREDIKWGEVVCAFPYIINVRMVDNFKKGRVFVTGDAAHIHSPTGGQGMNTGVQDSFNLGWKLALVMKGLAPQSLLDSFNEERLPVVSEMLNITNEYLKKTIAKNDEAAWDRRGSVNQLGVNYRGSPIVVDEESELQGVDHWAAGSRYNSVDGRVLAGDRAPDASGLIRIGKGDAAQTRLFTLLKPTQHTILIFAEKVDYHTILPALSHYPRDSVHPIVVVPSGGSSTDSNVDAVEDKDGHAHAAYNVTDPASSIFVIRPDGVVGARVTTAEALERYFRGIFKA